MGASQVAPVPDIATLSPMESPTNIAVATSLPVESAVGTTPIPASTLSPTENSTVRGVFTNELTTSGSAPEGGLEFGAPMIPPQPLSGTYISSYGGVMVVSMIVLVLVFV